MIRKGNRYRVVADGAIATAHYHKIKDFTEQEHEIPLTTLATLASLFVKHQVHNHFGISLLHRHQDTNIGSVMVHSKLQILDQEVDICQAKTFDSRLFHACSYFLDEDMGFLPYEYSTEDHGASAECLFLDELACFLLENKLQTVLALCCASKSISPWFEYSIPDNSGTIAVQNPLQVQLDLVEAEWNFHPLKDTITITTVKRCDKVASGAHTRPDDSIIALFKEAVRSCGSPSVF